MKSLSKTLLGLFISLTFSTASFATVSGNQTDALSPVQPASGVPFRVVIEKTNLQLPHGIHSGVVGLYEGYWVFIAGRLNGLHGFSIDNFPIEAQNKRIYVINPETGATFSRSLKEEGSGLNQQQIDSLSVTSPQGYQEGTTLYMTGGYGIDTATGTFNTKPLLTAIYLPGIIQWVVHPNTPNNSVAKNIRQIANPIFQIAGGKMYKTGNLTQLIFGQNFSGNYTVNSNGIYSEQVRQFQINDVKGVLSVNIVSSQPHAPDPDYRRRDLNINPVIFNNNNVLQYGYVAYAGVFTEASGVWTVPVVINAAGTPSMADPNSPATFKQSMSHYACASAGLYSQKNASMYNVFFGGLSYGFYNEGTFETDGEIPFINQVTTIKMDKTGNFTQYLMAGEYPTMKSTTVNHGNTLLFGAAAYFLPNTLLTRYPNKVFNLDNIRKPTVLGYIVGGIVSTLPNTNTIADSTASPYVFKVTLIPTN